MQRRYWAVITEICDRYNIPRKHKQDIHEAFKLGYGIESTKQLTEEEFNEYVWEVVVFDATFLKD